MQSMKRKGSNSSVLQVKPGKRKAFNVPSKSSQVIKTSPYFSGSQSAPAKSLKLQRSALPNSPQRASETSDFLLARCDDVKSTSINRVKPGSDAHMLSSSKRHEELDVQTPLNGKLASGSRGTLDVGKLSGKLNVPGSSPANPVCIGTRLQEDDSAKISLTARFNSEGSTSTQPKKDKSFPSDGWVSLLSNDDIEDDVQVLGEPPTNGSRRRQLRKAVDRVFDDSEIGIKPPVGTISASTVMKIEDEDCLNYKNSCTPTLGPRRPPSGNVNSSLLVEKSEKSGMRRARKTVVRDVKNSTETSESKGAIHGLDNICQEEIWEEEFAAFADRNITQSSTAAQLNMTAALKALEEVASKGQILHVEKIPARYVTYIRLLYSLTVGVTIFNTENEF